MVFELYTLYETLESKLLKVAYRNWPRYFHILSLIGNNRGNVFLYHHFSNLYRLYQAILWGVFF